MYVQDKSPTLQSPDNLTSVTDQRSLLLHPSDYCLTSIDGGRVWQVPEFRVFCSEYCEEPPGIHYLFSGHWADCLFVFCSSKALVKQTRHWLTLAETLCSHISVISGWWIFKLILTIFLSPISMQYQFVIIMLA